MYALDSGGNLKGNDTQNLGKINPYEMEQFEPPPIGAPSDYGVDDDGDGLFEQLVVVIPVETPSARKYNWSLAVANAKGETISQSAKSGELEAGRNELSFEFEGPVLREFGAHGPYRLRQFRFSAYFGGGPPRLFLDEIGTTQPYRADQFQSRPVQLLAVFPIGGWRGTRVQVEIRGQETSFEKDRTEIEAGQGIAAEVERVVGPDLLTARFAIGPDAVFGPRTVAVKTGDEVLTLRRAFAVQPVGAAPEAWLWTIRRPKRIRSLVRYPVDTNQDGRLDEVRFEAEVDVPETGQYDLILTFGTSDSRFLQPRVKVELQQGSNTLSLPVDVSALYEDAEQSPFRLRRVILRRLRKDGRRRPLEMMRVPDKQAEIAIPRSLQ